MNDDRLEEKPIGQNAQNAEQKAVVDELQKVLDHYKNARPDWIRSNNSLSTGGPPQ